MIQSKWKIVHCLLLGTLQCASCAYAHVGNKDIYQTVDAGPYRLFVTVRTPLVIPGVAQVELRSSGAPINSITVTPLPLTGEASKHPPTPDAMKASSSDPLFFTGSLWIMAAGSWQVRFHIDGAHGAATASVPVPAVATGILRMQRPMGAMLAIMGSILILGVVGIVIAGVREARLVPGTQPEPQRRRRALIAGAASFAVCAVLVWLGGKWWNVEAADYSAGMHRNSELRTSLDGNHLDLMIGNVDPEDGWKLIENAQLLTDHGHLMHLYAIRWPEMDAVFHLHPAPKTNGGFSETLPAMPIGTYRLYADVVFRNGFPETETAMLTIPAGMNGAPLRPEDARALPQAISAGQLGSRYHLPDGNMMEWEKPVVITANTPYTFVFRLMDPQGRPAENMQPYLGMAGHAAFVKSDGTAFAHTHPDGSAAMPAVMLANGNLGSGEMDGMADSNEMNMSAGPISSTVAFPYGFPSAGSYRIFVQMKQGSTVETGVFDASVQ